MRAGSSALPTVFAALMLLSAAWPAGQAGLAAVAPAALAVLAGVFIRVAATAAVLLTGAALVLLGAPALFAACSGLAAAAYLVTRHAVGRGGAAFTVPGAIGLIGFTLAGILATAVPLRLTWVPMLAPALVVVMLVVAGVPLLRRARGEPAAHPALDSDQPV
ncbi:MAG: hypothetical protein H6521_16440 [Mycolicibacterium sp.]|nr:hypothetical protein [Mycolicibacterium sp.]